MPEKHGYAENEPALRKAEALSGPLWSPAQKVIYSLPKDAEAQITTQITNVGAVFSRLKRTDDLMLSYIKYWKNRMGEHNKSKKAETEDGEYDEFMYTAHSRLLGSFRDCIATVKNNPGSSEEKAVMYAGLYLLADKMESQLGVLNWENDLFLNFTMHMLGIGGDHKNGIAKSLSSGAIAVNGVLAALEKEPDKSGNYDKVHGLYAQLEGELQKQIAGADRGGEVEISSILGVKKQADQAMAKYTQHVAKEAVDDEYYRAHTNLFKQLWYFINEDQPWISNSLIVGGAILASALTLEPGPLGAVAGLFDAAFTGYFVGTGGIGAAESIYGGTATPASLLMDVGMALVPSAKFGKGLIGLRAASLAGAVGLNTGIALESASIIVDGSKLGWAPEDVERLVSNGILIGICFTGRRGEKEKIAKAKVAPAEGKAVAEAGVGLAGVLEIIKPNVRLEFDEEFTENDKRIIAGIFGQVDMDNPIATGENVLYQLRGPDGSVKYPNTPAELVVDIIGQLGEQLGIRTPRLSEEITVRVEKASNSADYAVTKMKTNVLRLVVIAGGEEHVLYARETPHNFDKHHNPRITYTMMYDRGVNFDRISCSSLETVSSGVEVGRVDIIGEAKGVDLAFAMDVGVIPVINGIGQVVLTPVGGKGLSFFQKGLLKGMVTYLGYMQAGMKELKIDDDHLRNFKVYGENISGEEYSGITASKGALRIYGMADEDIYFVKGQGLVCKRGGVYLRIRIDRIDVEGVGEPDKLKEILFAPHRSLKQADRPMRDIIDKLPEDEKQSAFDEGIGFYTKTHKID